MIRGHGNDGNELVMEWEHTAERDNAPMNVILLQRRMANLVDVANASGFREGV
jgi:hypothetical protein